MKRGIFIKLLGVLHGIFGLLSLFVLWVTHYQMFFVSMTKPYIALKIIGTTIGSILLVLTWWASWMRPAISSSLAWGALAAYIITATGDVLLTKGLHGFSTLMAAFYAAVLVRALAACFLGYLTKTVITR
jgi:hypothetical protein